MDAKSITNKALAEEMEVSPETISRIVNASSAPGLDLLEKLADYFEVSIDSFFARSKHYC